MRNVSRAAAQLKMQECILKVFTPKEKTSMTSNNEPHQPGKSDLIYALDSKPPFTITILAAFQHILAMILGVMTPPAIVGTALGAPQGPERERPSGREAVHRPPASMCAILPSLMCRTRWA